jgi:SAM-dependent methyltransferase
MTPIYDDQFYQTIRDGSARSASVIVPLVIDLVRPSSVVDVGCGTGAWLACFQAHGVSDLLGIEGSEVKPHLAHLDCSHIRTADVSRPLQLDRTFDLAIRLEVAEHLPPDAAGGFVQSLAGLAPVVLFSAAVPDQGGVGHLNEQWPSYWAELFTANGFAVVDCLRDRIWRDQRVEWWYRQNLLLFVRQDLLSQYDRARDQASHVPALDRLMPCVLRRSSKLAGKPGSLGVVILTKNGVGRIVSCLQSVTGVLSPDEVVVFVDQDTADNTVELARQFTPHVHSIATRGSIESVLPEMISHCSTEYIFRIDDDETLGGNWQPDALRELLAAGTITHARVPRRWLVVPGDVFIANEPWFPDLQLRLFRNAPDLIRWPEAIHEPMVVRGHGLTLSDCWIDHHDLLVSSPVERKRKCQHYRSLRPGKHLSNFYLYEDQNLEFLPATAAGHKIAVDAWRSDGRPLIVPGTMLYQPGSDICFEDSENSLHFTGTGWSHPEPWGRWTDGDYSEILLPLSHPFDTAAVLTVEARAYLNTTHRTFRVQIECEDERIGTWLVDTAPPVERTVTIPAMALKGKTCVRLVFRIEHPCSPAESGESADPRLLGLGVRRLRLSGEHA